MSRIGRNGTFAAKHFILRKTLLKFPFVRSWIEGFQGVLAAHQNPCLHDRSLSIACCSVL